MVNGSDIFQQFEEHVFEFDNSNLFEMEESLIQMEFDDEVYQQFAGVDSRLTTNDPE